MKTKNNRKLEARQREKRKRIFSIGGMALVAVLIVAFLISQAPKQPAAGEFKTVEAQTWPFADGKSLGSPNAPLVVMEFADYQCPYCKSFAEQTMPSILADYVATGKIRYEYHHLIVIDSGVGGSESRRAAEAAECANEQGRFWDYSNMLYTNQGMEGSGAFSNPRLKAFAAALGLDTDQFNRCFDSGEYSRQVRDDESLARSYSLNSTPSLLVNGKLVNNPINYSQVQAAIDAALAQVAP